MPLIPGSSTTDPRYMNYVPGRPLTSAEIALRQSLGAAPMSSATNTSAANYSPGGYTPAATTNPTPTYSAPTAPSSPAPTGDNGAGLAQQGYDAQIQAIQNILNEKRGQAQSARDTGQSTFDTLLKSVNDFRDRSQTGFANAGQEITNRASEMLGSSARSGQEALGSSRALGRAMGLGDSSKFNQQNKVIASLAGTQGNTLARKGEQSRANDLNLQANQSLADQNESNANTYLQGINDYANQIENAGVNQFGTDTQLAQNSLDKSLQNILNYQRDLAALKVGDPTSFTSNFNGISNPLASLTGAVNPATAGTADLGANLYNPTTFLDIFKRQQGLV